MAVPETRAGIRLWVAAPAGVLAAILVGVTVGWPYAPASGWIVAAAVYLIWTWVIIGPMDCTATLRHATASGEDEDSNPKVAELTVVLASLGSLAGVGYLLLAETGRQPDVAAAVVGILSVAASWVAVHTAFTLRYARLYFPERAVDFHQEYIRPTYADFAYLAFTVGMTYQVSDTDIKSTEMRREVLFQALVSFVLGAIILAMTINLVIGLVSVGD
ncbi:MAG: DUF1345 domain-containing protein [Mycobacterium sp.]